ncbi:hypothetical protein CLOP_g20272 [Closterium sp. NIES-67]|nr:hypothetical protein CLOP_g20272 [Closterium sp. NIES-67]
MKSGQGGGGSKKPGVTAADSRGQRSIASFFGGKDQSGPGGKALPGGGQRSISSFFGARGKAGAGGVGKSEVEGSSPSAVVKASEEVKGTTARESQALEAGAAKRPVPTQTGNAVKNGDGAVATAGKEDTRPEQAGAEEWVEEMMEAEVVEGGGSAGGSAGGGTGGAVTDGSGSRRLKRLRKVGDGARGMEKGRGEGGGEGDGSGVVGGGTGEVVEGSKKARQEAGSEAAGGGQAGEKAAAAVATTAAAAAAGAAAKASASAVASAAAAASAAAVAVRGASAGAVTLKAAAGGRGRKKTAAATSGKAAADAPAADSTDAATTGTDAAATAEPGTEGGAKRRTRRRTSSQSSSSSSDSSGSSGSKGGAASAISRSTSDGADVDSDVDSASSDLVEAPADAAAGAEEAKSAFDSLKQGKQPTEKKAKRKTRGKGAGAGAGAAGGVGDGLVALAAKLVQYDPVAAATWKSGERVPFLYLAQALGRISNESGRLAITEIMTNVFRTVMATSPEDLLPIVYLAANRVAPPHEGVELGIGDATIIRALAEATGRKEATVKSEYKECGDLGLVAKASRTTQRMMMQPAPLTCHKVFEAFRFIAKESGTQSQEKKRARIKQLLVSARQEEPQFIVRLLQGKMRIGLAEQTVLAALAQAAVMHEDFREGGGAAGNSAAAAAGAGDSNGGGAAAAVDAAVGRGEDGAMEVGGAEGDGQGQQSQGGKVLSKRERLARLPGRLEEAVRIMKHTYSVLPVYDRVIPSLLKDGIWAVPDHCRFTLGVPVGPMLAKPTRGISEILDKLQGLTFTCEYKYDGERTQVHGLEDGSVQIYSRNAECTTGKFPDLVQAVQRHKKAHVKTFVLDAEAVAYDRESDKILPFQVLSTRARKGVIMGDIKVQVCMFAFDLLYLNGQQLLTEKLVRRRELLLGSFEPVKGEFQFATSIATNKEEELQAFFDDAVNHSCEGAMVKTLDVDATYEPAKRSNNWLKLKKDYMEGLGDSLDLVPIGAFHGRGKRTGVFGAFLLACYDPDTEEYQSICKIGTGFSEAALEERSASLRKRVIDKPPPYYRYGETLGVEVWFEPSEVWEVRAADLSISPVHRAAAGHVNETKGIALRFPRFLRLRDDKSAEQATSSEQVAQMYQAQKINHVGGAKDD